MGFFSGLDADKYDRQYTDTYLAKRIGRYFFEVKNQVVGIVLGFTFVAIMSSVRPVLISLGLDFLADESNLIPLILAALFFTAIIEYAANWMRRRLLTRVISTTVARMRQESFNAAVNRDMAFYDTNKTGKILSRITSDTQEFGDVVILTSDVMAQLISMSFLAVILFNQSPYLTLVLLATLPLFAITTYIFRAFARYVTRQGARMMAIVNDNIQESVTGISVAKNFRKEATIYREFTEVNNRSYSVNLRRGFVLVMLFPVMSVMEGVASIVIINAGVVATLDGLLTIGTLYLFIQGVNRFMFPIINIASFWSQFQQGLSAAERVFSLIDTENTVVQTDHQPATSINGHIVFNEVLFEYISGQPILESFNLDIKPGESVAFVGHTGAGKSTITKLISRFYEFQGGQICIDGRDIRSFNLQSYRSQLGIVPQQPFLFSGTILDNIRYARPDVPDDEINEIVYSIGNGEWLETLPDGLMTDVGERGSRLSMGQRQLVSLIRVLVQKPAIFVLDEATASIDPFTEMQIQEALDLILQRATSILIAHRLSTVRSADRIIVLKDGKIIEEGNHEALMASGGHYAELYNTYFRHQSLTYVENAKDQFQSAVSASSSD